MSSPLPCFYYRNRTVCQDELAFLSNIRTDIMIIIIVISLVLEMITHYKHFYRDLSNTAK